MSRKPSRQLLVGALLSSLLCGLLLLTSACFRSGPADTVKQFYRNVEKGKLDDAMELPVSF
jgi:hypothetical protein